MQSNYKNKHYKIKGGEKTSFLKNIVADKK